ncbi:hypothetical protein ANANG_G00057360, partial [Anguilla anguilla]
RTDERIRLKLSLGRKIKQPYHTVQVLGISIPPLARLVFLSQGKEVDESIESLQPGERWRLTLVHCHSFPHPFIHPLLSARLSPHCHLHPSRPLLSLPRSHFPLCHRLTQSPPPPPLPHFQPQILPFSQTLSPLLSPPSHLPRSLRALTLTASA